MNKGRTAHGARLPLRTKTVGVDTAGTLEYWADIRTSSEETVMEETERGRHNNDL